MQKPESIFAKCTRVIQNLNIRSCPELELFPTDQERRKSARRASRSLRKKPWFYLVFVGAIGFSIGSTLFLRSVVGSLGLPISQLVQKLILAIPVIAVGYFVCMWFLQKYLSVQLRHELLRCDVPVCVKCGYHLVGLSVTDCPECGKPFDEKVLAILGKE